MKAETQPAFSLFHSALQSKTSAPQKRSQSISNRLLSNLYKTKQSIGIRRKQMTKTLAHSDLLWETRPRDLFWGERLQIAREFKGITQKELSEQVSASRALVSLCEAGKKNPSRDLVEAFG